MEGDMAYRATKGRWCDANLTQTAELSFSFATYLCDNGHDDSDNWYTYYTYYHGHFDHPYDSDGDEEEEEEEEDS